MGEVVHHHLVFQSGPLEQRQDVVDLDPGKSFF